MSAVVVMFSAVSVFAAGLSAKVAAVDGDKVSLTLEGEKADWIKKGAAVVLKSGVKGKIVEVTDGKVVVTTGKAAELKAGDALSLEKGKAALQGC